MVTLSYQSFKLNSKIMKDFKIIVYLDDVLFFSTKFKKIKKKDFDKIMEIFKEKFSFKDGFDMQILGWEYEEYNYTMHYVLPPKTE